MADQPPSAERPPIICFSHLRWDFVLQRPQHLLGRFARDRDVFFWEEPIVCDHPLAYYEIHTFAGTSVRSIRPRLPHWWDHAARQAALSGMLDDLIRLACRTAPVLWYYTPSMRGFSAGKPASAVVYDCMDELSGFRFAASDLPRQEEALMAEADVVFTGGQSLYEARRLRHDNIHCFPSSVEAAHFAAARGRLAVPADQAAIHAASGGPILGYYGVIDERLDLDLIGQLAALRPDYSFVFLGPLAKIEPQDLPRRPNLHFLGQKAYADLPAYVSGWQAALMPFALNEATRFISPTKTPEYLAAGRPVVSTPIADVVRQYGAMPGVFIRGETEGFAAACDAALSLPVAGDWLAEADRFLASTSWDETFRAMNGHLEAALARRAAGGIERGAASLRRAAQRRRENASGAAGRPYDVIIAGAGFAGSVLAERLAAEGGKRVLLCDRRPHIGGNAYDEQDEAGILIHRYGPHIFHTNSEEVFGYLSRFTAWRPYEHRVLADVGGGKLLPMPINRTTLNGLYGLDLSSDEEAAAFLAARAEPVADIRSSRDVVVSQVGEDLYRTFFRGYTRKQWGLDPSELDRSVTARVPTRTDLDDRYFQDKFQAMPLHGYTRMFENMLDHDGITLAMGTEFADARREAPRAHVIFTGPIDEYFDHRFGRLPYRSLEFRFETHDRRRVQPVAVVNYPDEAVPYTRVTEYKYLTGQVHPRTTVSYEYARADGDPYYPIPRPENQALFARYDALGRETPGVTFVGRLGSYRYYNMDQVVGQALATWRRLKPVLGIAAEPQALTPGA